MNRNYSARDAIEGILRLEREIIELYRRVAEHELRSQVGARLQVIEARHLAAATRSERLLENVRHNSGGGIVSDLAAQISSALVGLIAGVPVEFIEETHTPTIATLRRFEERLHDCYIRLAGELDTETRGEAHRGASETKDNLAELVAMESIR